MRVWMPGWSPAPGRGGPGPAEGSCCARPRLWTLRAASGTRSSWASVARDQRARRAVGLAVGLAVGRAAARERLGPTGSAVTPFSRR